MRKCQGNPHFLEPAETLVFIHFSGFQKNPVKKSGIF